MKITAALLLIACLQVCARGKAQTISLSFKNAPLEEVFKEVKKQTGYRFIYTQASLEEAKNITIEINNVKIEQALPLIFKDQPFTYALENKIIVLKRSPTAPVEEVQQPLPPIDIKGTITNEKGIPVAGATITVKGARNAVPTNDKGEFILAGVNPDVTIVITSVGYETQEVKLNGKKEINIRLKVKLNELSSVEVTLSTGYQSVQQNRTTGSFVKIDNELFNRSVSTDVLSRLDGVTSGLIFNKNTGDQSVTNQSNITIRGRSTIYANPNPLVVVNNFPYDGDISAINPNDIESITILKDAAAASIWGAFSGNGVIVITTKRGKFNQLPRIAFNSNISVTSKPDLYYNPQLGSSDYIDVEKYLFEQGYYDGAISTNYSILSPVVEILNKQQSGLLSADQANSQIAALRLLDVRRDVGRYFYQKSVNQQYAVNISGGSANNTYFFSAGYDNNTDNLVRDQSKRFSFNTGNSYFSYNHRLELSTEMVFTRKLIYSNGMSSAGVSYPYAQLVDNNKPASLPANFSESYTDTAGQGLLLDWKYRPLDELKFADNTSRLTDYRLSAVLKYLIIKGISISALVQYNQGDNTKDNFYSQQTYYTRNLINTYSQVNYSSGAVTRPIPLGGILDEYLSGYKSTNVRTQVDINRTFNNDHTITAIAGAEIRSAKTNSSSNRLYGYDNNLGSSIPVDYVSTFPLYYNSSAVTKIDYRTNNSYTENNFISFFGNAFYEYKRRYGLSMSARKDEANIFGVKTNQKGVPLWSVGGSWTINNEPFYKVGWLPELRIRITDGYNGNIDQNLSALVTASSGLINRYGLPTLSLNNAPNSELRWEKINTVNCGVDFSLKNNILTGSIEYYRKNGMGLIGSSPIDPTTGITYFTGNTANMNGQGVDLNLQTNNLGKAKLKWQTNFLLSYTKDKVTKYLVQPSTVSNFFSTSINPIAGRPLYSIYSLPGYSLNSQTGDPQVFFEGKVTSDYASIMGSANINSLKYNGPAMPVLFGSIRNSFTYQHVSLSFNITYKLGYYFRRASLSYVSLFSGGAIGNSDYTKRWQSPGDETKTIVPSLAYPANDSRDNVYRFSNVLVDKGGNIRLQDIRISYDLKQSKTLLRSASIYIYASNLGILWRANKDHIDPDYIPTSGVAVYPNPRSLSAGIKLDL